MTAGGHGPFVIQMSSYFDKVNIVDDLHCFVTINVLVQYTQFLCALDCQWVYNKNIKSDTKLNFLMVFEMEAALKDGNGQHVPVKDIYLLLYCNL